MITHSLFFSYTVGIPISSYRSFNNVGIDPLVGEPAKLLCESYDTQFFLQEKLRRYIDSNSEAIDVILEIEHF